MESIVADIEVKKSESSRESQSNLIHPPLSNRVQQSAPCPL
jgi:hypothetical protein